MHQVLFCIRKKNPNAENLNYNKSESLKLSNRDLLRPLATSPFSPSLPSQKWLWLSYKPAGNGPGVGVHAGLSGEVQIVPV